MQIVSAKEHHYVGKDFKGLTNEISRVSVEFFLNACFQYKVDIRIRLIEVNQNRFLEIFIDFFT